jgi:hypothetical protein
MQIAGPAGLSPCRSAPSASRDGRNAPLARSFFLQFCAGFAAGHFTCWRTEIMAYDRYDSRSRSRWGDDDRSRWSGDRDRYSGRGRDDERGFFERAGDEIASWFGDEDAERRRQRERGYGSADDRHDRDYDRGYGGSFERDHDRERFGERARMRERPERGRYEGREEQSGYRPITGDYGRSEGFFAASGMRDEPSRRSAIDPHYHSWRSRQIDELDRDYEDYRRENQARFEDDFSNWRKRRGEKRSLLGQIREHMEVVGNDGEHVGTVDRTAGDRIILAKSDPESGGAHHSLSCSDIDRVEGDKVVLDCPSADAKQRWRDESRNRALFEREDQGEMGPRVLDRSFEGTYR